MEESEGSGRKTEPRVIAKDGGLRGKNHLAIVRCNRKEEGSSSLTPGNAREVAIWLPGSCLNDIWEYRLTTEAATMGCPTSGELLPGTYDDQHLKI